MACEGEIVGLRCAKHREALMKLHRQLHEAWANNETYAATITHLRAELADERALLKECVGAIESGKRGAIWGRFADALLKRINAALERSP